MLSACGAYIHIQNNMGYNDTTDITNTTMIILKHKYEALESRQLPTSELLDVQGEYWVSYFGDQHTLESVMKVWKEHVSTLQGHEYNKQLRDIFIATNNFDVFANKALNHGEITLLVTAKQNLNGEYVVPDAGGEKYHAWLKTKYYIPDTIEDIDQRLAEIVGNDMVPLTASLAYYKTLQADLGIVPLELRDTDTEWWVMYADLQVCKVDPVCNVKIRQQWLDERGWENEPIIPPPNIPVPDPPTQPTQ